MPDASRGGQKRVARQERRGVRETLVASSHPSHATPSHGDTAHSNAHTHALPARRRPHPASADRGTTAFSACVYWPLSHWWPSHLFSSSSCSPSSPWPSSDSDSLPSGRFLERCSLW